MITAEVLAGGSRKLTLSFEYHLSPRHERLGSNDPTAAGFAVRLSDARQHKPGQLVHVIANTGSVNLPVDDKSDNPLTQVIPGKAVEFWLVDNSTSAGTWQVSRQFTATFGVAI